MLWLRRRNAKRRITAGICATVFLLLVCAYVINMPSTIAAESKYTVAADSKYTIAADSKYTVAAESKYTVADDSQHTIAAEAQEFERLVSKLSAQRSSENFTIAPLDNHEHWLIRVQGADVAAVAFPFTSPQVRE